MKKKSKRALVRKAAGLIEKHMRTLTPRKRRAMRKDLHKLATRLPKFAFVLNRRSGIYHRQSTREQCNIDQVPRRFKLYVDLPPRGAPRCKHCA